MRGQALAEGALPEVAALMVRIAAETALDEYRAKALQVLAHGRQADVVGTAPVGNRAPR